MSHTREETNGETVSYIFETQYNTKHPDIRLAAVGSLECVGNWNIRNAKIAKEIPKRSGRWLAAIECPSNTSFEWKWALVRKPNKEVVRWEERPNRSFTSGKCPGRVMSPWNGGMELLVIPDNKFKHHGVDIADDEKDDEWSYLPSESMLKQLMEDSDDDSVSEKVIDHKKKSVEPNKTCVNRWTRKLWSGDQTSLLFDDVSSRSSGTPEDDSVNTNENEQLIQPRPQISESMISRARNLMHRFCTIL